MGRTLVLVSHPDDETIGCGALLQRMREPVVVFATDGAPNDSFFWNKYGSRLRYQRVREEEARNALSFIGVSEIEFLGSQAIVECEGIPDQRLHEHLSEAYDMLSVLMNLHKPDAIVTLAYEGGHPDHDCCSMLGAQLSAQFQVPIWEFPLYHRNANGEMVYQEFLVASPNDTKLELSVEELFHKQSMLNAYASQQPFLQEFGLSLERFRPQQRYDYLHRPHKGKLNYEVWQWPVTGEDACAAFCNFVAVGSGVSR